MRKNLLAVVLILLFISIFLARNFLTTIGLGLLSMINVSIQEKIGGKLLLSYKQFIEIGNQQEIYTEFINIGTSPLTERIEVKVYGYVNGTLKPLAYYYDISVPLPSGGRKGFLSIFMPPDTGLYYIQAKASYDTKVLETWGAFLVHLPPPPVIYVPTPVSLPTPPTPIVGVPDLSLEYPKLIEFYPGEKKLINITIKSVGTASLHNLRLYTSTSSLINVSVFPKQILVLSPNETSIFIVSIEVPSTTEDGIYPLEFETMNDEGIKKKGEISIKVISLPPSEEGEISEKILNYEFLISEIQREINYASFQGYDVELANKSLSMARISLENAKGYLKLKRIQDAKLELKKVEKYIEDSALQLASSLLYIYKPPAILWWLIISIIILIASIILVYLYFKKRRRKRPRLLEGVEEIEK
ncbi:MAG: hypothetical protein QW040_00100 [Candidatus Aenigmatarchaeota archaeon]